MNFWENLTPLDSSHLEVFLGIFHFLNSNLNFEFGPVWYRPGSVWPVTSQTGPVPNGFVNPAAGSRCYPVSFAGAALGYDGNAGSDELKVMLALPGSSKCGYLLVLGCSTMSSPPIQPTQAPCQQSPWNRSRVSNLLGKMSKTRSDIRDTIFFLQSCRNSADWCRYNPK